MPQDMGAELVIEIPTDSGGTITVTIGEEDFVVDAARGQPEPLLDRAVDVVGGGIRAAVSHPIDVNVAWWYAAAFAGAFGLWSDRPQQNAQRAARVFRDNWLTMRRPADRRVAIQMLLLYYETDVRTKLLWQLAGRQVGGTLLSMQIYSFGGRLAPNLKAKLALGAHNLVASMAGAAVRGSIAVMETSDPNDLTGHIVGPHFLINALLTGDDTVFNLAHTMGPQVYFQLMQHLREHPEAIQIDDAEYALINSIVIWLEEYFSDPAAALENPPTDLDLERLQ